VKLSGKMKELMENLKKIGKLSLAHCRHEDEEVGNDMVEINSLAKSLYEELNRVEHNIRHEEQKEANSEEPVIKFL
jgi:hypothetical protein